MLDVDFQEVRLAAKFTLRESSATRASVRPHKRPRHRSGVLPPSFCGAVLFRYNAGTVAEPNPIRP